MPRIDLWRSGRKWAGFDGECPGECCRLITLNLEPEAIAAHAALGRYLEKTRRLEFPADFHCAQFVVDNFQAVRRSMIQGTTGERLVKGPAVQYRCGAWDGRRCSKYSERPAFCRSYGTDRNQLCLRPDCSRRPYPVWYALDRLEDDGGPPLPDEVVNRRGLFLEVDVATPT